MQPLLRHAYSIFLVFLDRGLFEVFGPLGLLRLGSSLARGVASLQTSYLFNYIYLLVFNIVLLVYYTLIVFNYIM
jgi:hypothetical protein